MSIFRRGRFVFWAIRELSKKYTRSLIIGILLGFGLMFFIWTIFPLLQKTQLVSIKRIGYVGDYSPSTLPLDIQQQISYGLTTLTDEGKATPGLATSWEATESGTVYIFHLQKDATWHDGKPVLASDINYNIEHVTFEAIDDATLKVTLPNPFSVFPILVSKPIFSSKLKGIGPYKVSTLRLKGDKITYLKLVSADLTTKPALEYRFYKSEELAMIAYKLGEIDELSNISVIDPSMEQWKNTNIQKTYNKHRIITLYFNMKDALLKEKQIRQMLAYAVPDLGFTRAYSPIAETSWAYEDAVKHYAPDLAQAKKLFEATHMATTSGELTITTFSQYLTIAQTIAKSWQDLGLNVKIQVDNTIGDPYQILLSAQDIPTDPDQYVYWHSTQRTNISGITNAKIDKLLEDGRVEQDDQKRRQLYLDFQKRLVEELPALFLYYPTEYSIVRSN